MGGINSQRSKQAKKVKYTICDVHRDIYHYVKKLDNLSDQERDFILEKVETAFAKGKHMAAKLTQYAHGKDTAWFEKEKRTWQWSELKEEDRVE